MKTYIQICESCKKEFPASRCDAKYCSTACRQGAYNRRMRSSIKQAETLRSTNENRLLERLNALETQMQAKGILDSNKSADFLHAENTKTDGKNNETESALISMLENQTKAFNDAMNRMKEDSAKRATENTNEKLKACLTELIQLTKQDVIYTWRVRLMTISNKSKLGSSCYDLPENYKYKDFINNELLPRMQSTYNQLRREKERKISFSISEEFEVKIKEILKELA